MSGGYDGDDKDLVSRSRLGWRSGFLVEEEKEDDEEEKMDQL